MLRVALHERGDVTAAVYTGTSLGVNTFRSPPQCCPPQDVLGGGGRGPQPAEPSDCEPWLFLPLWFLKSPHFLTLSGI